MLRPPALPKPELSQPSDLEVLGYSVRGIGAATSRGELRRLRNGVYIRGSAWASMKPEARQLAHARAVGLTATRPELVFSHTSAAAMWGLPLFKLDPAVVHTLAPTRTGTQSSAELRRHTGDIDDGELISAGGLTFTSLERTVFDLIREVSVEAGVACADAAMRAIAWNPARSEYDHERAEHFRAALDRRIHDAPGARNIRRARGIVAFADGRAQLPGESVSRLFIARLGFAPPRLQVSVPAPRSGNYFVDFEFDEEGAFGEFDGEGKYLDPSMLRGRTTERAVLDEKEREDWIRGLTNRRFARWKMADLASAETLGRRLAAFGIAPGPGRRRTPL